MANFAIPVTEYMSAPVHTARTHDDLNRVQGLLDDHGVGALAIVDDAGALAGVISRTDLLRVGRSQAGAAQKASLLTLPHLQASEVMTRDVVTVDFQAPLDQAAKTMIERRIHRVFVAQNGHPVGVVSTKDLMRAVLDKRANHPIADYMSSPIFTVRASETIALATERLERAKVSGVIVVDDHWPVGIFTQREALISKDLPRNTPIEECMSPAILCLSAETKVFRAAQQAIASRVRRIITVKNERPIGITTGLDFARVVC